jgi:dCTP deaminase
MTFWTSQKLEANLARLTDYPNPDMVDCNALTLRVGPEVYITPGLEQSAPNSHTKTQLGPSAPIAIPPGQFAFLLTEETITIPPEVMGLISIKASFKMRGLVNVSGFHVDPGWSGPLIFTVFNAGPATVHLERGLPVFLLWIAELEEASDKHKTTPGTKGIPPAIISNITGVVDSIYALEKRLKGDVKAVADKQDSFRDQIAEVKERQSKVLLYLGLAAVVAGAIVGVSVKILADFAFPAASPAITAPAPAPPQDLLPRPTPADPPPALPSSGGNTAGPKGEGS